MIAHTRVLISQLNLRVAEELRRGVPLEHVLVPDDKINNAKLGCEGEVDQEIERAWGCRWD